MEAINTLGRVEVLLPMLPLVLLQLLLLMLLQLKWPLMLLQLKWPLLLLQLQGSPATPTPACPAEWTTSGSKCFRVIR